MKIEPTEEILARARALVMASGSERMLASFDLAVAARLMDPPDHWLSGPPYEDCQ